MESLLAGILNHVQAIENLLVPCNSYIIHDLACISQKGTSDRGELYAAALCILACVSDFWEKFRGG